MNDIPNTRVLVIDDEIMVRDNIEEILVPKHFAEAEMVSKAASLLFDSQYLMPTERGNNIPRFSVDKASNGMEGVEMVKLSLIQNRPYAVIFLDMRMPGWDGLETAIRIREYDVKAEIIFITAFSDRSIGEIMAKAGQNVGYHCKPYAAEEIIQLATKAVVDYNKLRNLEDLIDMISSIGVAGQQMLPVLLRNILDQLATYIGSDMAVMGKITNNYVYEKLFSIGTLEQVVNIDELIVNLKDNDYEQEQVIQLEEVVLVKLETYTIFAVLKKEERLKTEKLYLLKLFVQNAAKAIRNAELQDKLILKEKLALIGNAVGMIMHDLRSPIKNIAQFTEILRGEQIDNNEFLDAIDTCAHQASEIFDDLLDFVNNSALKKVRLNLGHVIREGVRIAELKSGTNAVEIYTIIDDEIEILGDASKLRRIIANLVSNALEALSNLPMNGKQVHISSLPELTRATITIRDNGPGIPVEILDNLFEPFVTKNKSNGTGLGLAIVRQYIEAHGGTVSVRNEGGAVFDISLPIVTQNTRGSDLAN